MIPFPKESDMLVLTRKPHEEIHIGDDVVIKVVSISGSRVKVAVDAPSDIDICRSEITSLRGLDSSARS